MKRAPTKLLNMACKRDGLEGVRGLAVQAGQQDTHQASVLDLLRTGTQRQGLQAAAASA